MSVTAGIKTELNREQLIDITRSDIARTKRQYKESHYQPIKALLRKQLKGYEQRLLRLENGGAW